MKKLITILTATIFLMLVNTPSIATNHAEEINDGIFSLSKLNEFIKENQTEIIIAGGFIAVLSGAIYFVGVDESISLCADPIEKVNSCFIDNTYISELTFENGTILSFFRRCKDCIGIFTETYNSFDNCTHVFVKNITTDFTQKYAYEVGSNNVLGILQDALDEVPSMVNGTASFYSVLETVGKCRGQLLNWIPCSLFS